MLIVKDKGKNSKIYISRSNASLDETDLFVTEKRLQHILKDVVYGGEITQSEYNALLDRGEIDDNALYFITDAKVNIPYITGTQMVEYVDDVVGDINKILEDILG